MAIDPIPVVPTTIKPKLSDQVKSSTPQYIVYEDTSSNTDIIVDLLFENLSAHELINIARNDNINGQKFYYNPIKNLVDIQAQFNPNNILKLQDTSEQYFKKYPIKLDEKIPNQGNGLNGNNIYFDEDGNLIIETINNAPDEQVEVQIALGGTIYEAIL
jgi:hypothetical protein